MYLSTNLSIHSTFLHTHLYIYLSIHPLIYLPIHRPTHPSIHLPTIHLPIHLPINPFTYYHPSPNLPTHLRIHPSIHPSIHPFTDLPCTYPPYLPNHPSIHLSIYPLGVSAIPVLTWPPVLCCAMIWILLYRGYRYIFMDFIGWTKIFSPAAVTASFAFSLAEHWPWASEFHSLSSDLC